MSSSNAPPDRDSDQAPLIVWFRQDLRLSDNPALSDAVARGVPLLPLFILDDDGPGAWRIAGAGRWWLHRSLDALAGQLAALGSRLILRRGPADAVLRDMVAETGAAGVVWNRLYEPWAVARDRTIKRELTAAELEAQSFKGAVLFEPWEILTKGKQPFRVFTPFWRACLAAATPPQAPLRRPPRWASPTQWPRSDSLASWGLLPKQPNWASGFEEAWRPGEAGARARLDAFLTGALAQYESGRDRPDQDGSSRLSPHLHWGEISPRQVWHRVQAAMAEGRVPGRAGEAFLRELGWREFSIQLLYHQPELPTQPLQAAFRQFPWQQDAAVLRAWQRGRTGYPIVDAGMRQLWAMGWMHNRVRMIVGSFLVKHLLQPWQVGEAWFWDTLVDADLANNSASWQWIAGCGADAAPYFRVFNPITQGEKFDPDGTYVRRWVPELARLPASVIHRPWEATPLERETAGVALGDTYPAPIVDHREGRERALAAWRTLRSSDEEI